jgi:hypothetical protein
MSMRNANTPSGFAAVTKSDSTFVDFMGIYVGGTGDVAVEDGAGNSTTFPSVPAGLIIPGRIRRVLSTGTTATNIVGFKP